VPQSAGLAITAFTLLIKGVTFPLNYQQMASTTKIQVARNSWPQAGSTNIRSGGGCFASLLPLFSRPEM